MFDGRHGAAEETLASVRDAASLPDVDVVRLLTELESLARLVDAAGIRLAAEVAHRSRRELGPERLSAARGCRTAAELLQRATGIAGAAAHRRIRLGLATRAGVSLVGGEVPARFPAVADALAEGSLGVDAAHAIITTLEPTLRVADPSHVARAEGELVRAATETWATGLDGRADHDAESAEANAGTADSSDRGSDAAPVLDADSVRLQARVWAEFLDPDGGAPDERDEDRRFLTLQNPRRGLVPITGLLLPQVAAALRTYADAWTNPRTEPVPDPTRGADTSRAGAGPVAAAATDASPRAAHGAGDGDVDGTKRPEPAEPTETRSRAQVMHDVLATALNVAARVVDAPSVAGNAPTLVVIARASELRSGDGAAQADDGALINLAAARHVGCAGAIQRVELDGAGRVAGIWSPERCFSGTQRRAIAIRDGGCVIPGCQVPAAWCEVHHVVPHAEDPSGTTTDNGALLCWHHHRTIDTSGWAIRMVDGLPWVQAPGWLDRARRWRPARPPGAAAREPGTAVRQR